MKVGLQKVLGKSGVLTGETFESEKLPNDLLVMIGENVELDSATAWAISGCSTARRRHSHACSSRLSLG